MINFIFGKEHFLVREKFLKLKNDFTSKNPTASVVDFDLEENFDLGELKKVFGSGGGLFSEKKLVILRGVFSLNESSQRILHEIIKKQTQAKSDDLEVIIVEFNKKAIPGKLVKFLKTSKKVKSHEFKPFKPFEMQKWIVDEINKRGEGKISVNQNAGRMLSEMATGGLWQLNQEIEKLANYKPSGEITEEEIELLCHGETEAMIFDLVDAAVGSNKDRALELNSKLIRQGNNEFYIFTMVVNQMKNLIKIQDATKKGMMNEKMIAGKLKIHPFVVKKSLSQLKRFSGDQLKKIFNLAAQIDRDVKIGKQTMGEALELLIIKI